MTKDTIKAHITRPEEPAQPGAVTVTTRITKVEWPPKEPIAFTSGRPTAFRQRLKRGQLRFEVEQAGCYIRDAAVA